MAKNQHTEQQIIDRCEEFHREINDMIGDIHSHGEGEVGIIFGTARAVIEGADGLAVRDRTVTVSGSTAAIAHVVAEVFVRYPFIRQMAEEMTAEMTRGLRGCN